jgi:hypothetical protein
MGVNEVLIHYETRVRELQAGISQLQLPQLHAAAILTIAGVTSYPRKHESRMSYRKKLVINRISVAQVRTG